MDDGAPRVLFVPVSGEFGMGEYARSLSIARGVHARWPGASIRFVLSRRAPYAAAAPFPSLLLDASPTFHTREVCALIEEWRPALVVFDNAGRTAQLRMAVRCGARVVYISARRRQRNKAFRLRWMRLIDEHWIAYPAFVAGPLRPLERLKLAWLRRPRLRYLDVILAAPNPACTLAGDLASYVLVVPGGGTGHPGAAGAVAAFLDAARAVAAGGVDTLFIGPAQPPGGAAAGGSGRLRMLPHVPQADLAQLMRGARLVIANGGSTLLQVIACGRPCLAVPIAGDQAERIRRCVAARVARAAPLDGAAMGAGALRLLGDAGALGDLARHAARLGLADGVAVAVDAVAALAGAR